MRGALVGRITTAAGFHMQNMCDVIAKTLECRSKYIHILNPTVRDDITLTAVINCQRCFNICLVQDDESESRHGAASRGRVTFDTYATCMSSVAGFVYSFFSIK